MDSFTPKSYKEKLLWFTNEGALEEGYQTITKARASEISNWLEEAQTIAYKESLIWKDPHIGIDFDQAISLEWWSGSYDTEKHKLIVFIDPGEVSFIKCSSGSGDEAFKAKGTKEGGSFYTKDNGETYYWDTGGIIKSPADLAELCKWVMDVKSTS